MAIKIFIDQGHNPGYPNAGAEGNGLKEQDVTYTVGVELASLLNSNGNFETMLSRNIPNEILGTSNASSLYARTNMANQWGADYFISIHANASVLPEANGTEGYVYSFSSPAYPLATDIVQGISEATGIVNRGVFERPSLYVLRKTAMPATLIEIGFITNENEAVIMETNPSLFARGMYNGIIKYFGLN